MRPKVLLWGLCAALLVAGGAHLGWKGDEILVFVLVCLTLVVLALLAVGVVLVSLVKRNPRAQLAPKLRPLFLVALTALVVGGGNRFAARTGVRVARERGDALAAKLDRARREGGLPERLEELPGYDGELPPCDREGWHYTKMPDGSYLLEFSAGFARGIHSRSPDGWLVR